MQNFEEFFLEYAHNMADGTPKISPFMNNKKGSRDIVKPLDMTRKYIHTKGPYKPELTLGQSFIGADALADILYKLFQSTDSLDNFEEGKILKSKNSELGLQLKTVNGQPSAFVIKIK